MSVYQQEPSNNRAWLKIEILYRRFVMSTYYLLLCANFQGQLCFKLSLPLARCGEGSLKLA
jgi:hypothetical protein